MVDAEREGFILEPSRFVFWIVRWQHPWTILYLKLIIEYAASPSEYWVGSS